MGYRTSFPWTQSLPPVPEWPPAAQLRWIHRNIAFASHLSVDIYRTGSTWQLSIGPEDSATQTWWIFEAPTIPAVITTAYNYFRYGSGRPR